MQQIPGRFKGNEGEVRLDVYTFLNPMNNYWGQRRITGIYPTRTLVNYEGANAQGQYVNKLPTDKNGPQASVGSSETDFVWLSFALVAVIGNVLTTDAAYRVRPDARGRDRS